jgi:hypothetical protein
MPHGVLLTVPGLTEPWTRIRPHAHRSLDAGQRTPAPTAPWKTGQQTPVSHTANRTHHQLVRKGEHGDTTTTSRGDTPRGNARE